MQGFAYWRSHCFAEGVGKYLCLDGWINLVHIAHTATQNNAIGVEQIDDLRQGTAQSVQEAIKALRSIFVAAAHGMNDLHS